MQDTKDQLQRLMFEEINARCVRVHLCEVLKEAIGSDRYPASVEQLLAEGLLVAGLLSSGLKFEGRISLQLQSSGPLKFLLADCTDDGGMRCVARLAEDALLPESRDALWQSLRQGGILTLTLEPTQAGERWQGIVPLEGRDLAEALESYFERSEQLATRLRLAVDGTQGSALMIQKMPGEGSDEDGWNRLEHLVGTVGDRELLDVADERLFHRLFHAEERRQFPARPLRFHCPCSRARVERVLIGLGAEEIRSMVEAAETVEVQCEFCGKSYAFDPVQLAVLMDEAPTAESRTLH
ncbi:Hsp33 family molecular chaperone HslO [Wenzhouxiangella marina]|uniref:33 kDa chaperonin n=1 Tax=Wenzhouxiangella marina TaxID=1579979 RepID=A0A0K0XWR4_9GAMM|nr:Hsp33 family molecular chaperone HslO [Wenzhouxiangella marina]AKS42072.1 33 kDa chaperonin [Wenzhouxiangella marina]MBB6086159.1 molecular chaperone Hsp33 [Wenzhouxiangella marina]